MTRGALRRIRLLSVVSGATLLVATGAVVPFTGHVAQAQTETSSSADRYNDSYADLVQRVMPAVVNVSVEKTEQVDAERTPLDDPEMRRFFERFFGQQMPAPDQRSHSERELGEGSGFVISKDGYIVTNAHVAGGASKIEVSFQDGTKLPATLKGIDEKTDLAVLKVEAHKDLTFVSFGDSSKVRVGDKVLAVGNPFGLGGTVTAGIISATQREIGAGPYDDFLQVDAAINRGNSGGPTFNLNGQVIGINSMIFSPSGGSIGIGFAISSNLAKSVIQQLTDDGKVDRGWLGVGIQPVDEDIASSLGLKKASGALVSKVEEGSPAEAAGLKTGDVIVGFNGKAVEKVRDLTRAVADTKPGSTESLDVVSGGSTRSVKVNIGEMPTDTTKVAANDQDGSKSQAKIGLALAPLSPDLRKQLNLPATAKGVVVSDVEDGSPAASKGIQAGDLILKVGDKAVSRPEDVVKAITAARERGEKAVLMLFQRDGAQLFAAVPFSVS
ncbi:serine protease Do [Arboricoccus pini]|uniref:Probable periplasmic serine endoprotease DegP-like n=1 Tax=Arboricoccus pini TaxID=1963835 RepID=A0A212QNB7_9PROT|nr:DegQ family serine endoprotease [Arboricoccus pini]SNB60891.1 serine protease Do [Arboricoccus pini]